MKLVFKQRFFSWFDSYDIFDEAGNTLFVVKGELAWGHLLRIYDANGIELGYVKEKIFTLFLHLRYTLAIVMLAASAKSCLF